MDAADLLLAALDEAGISNELEDIFEPTPTQLVEPKATGKPQVVAAPAAPQQPARPVVIPSVQVPQRQHIRPAAVQPVVIPQRVTNGPIHTHIKQEPLLKGQLISTQNVTRSSPLTNGPVGTLPKTALTTGSSNGATVNVPPARPQKWVSRGKPIPSLHAPVVKEEDGQEETATNNNKPPPVTLVPSASIKQEPVLSHQPAAVSFVKCPPQAPAQPKVSPPPLMTGDVLGGGAAPAVSAPAAAPAAAGDIWGGGSDVDMFSQALMQLQQTNAKAAQFEAKIKSKKPEDTKPSSAPATPVTVPDRAAPPSVIKPVIKHAVPTVSTVSLGQATQTKVIPNPRLQAGQLVRTPVVTARNTLSATVVSNVPPLPHTAQSGTDIISSAFASATGATQPSSLRFASQLSGVPNNNRLTATPTPSGIQSISQAIQNVVKSGNASISGGQGNPVTIKIIQPPGGQNRILQTRSGSPQSLVIKQVSKPAGNNVVTVTPSQGASPLPQQSVKIMKTADGRTLRIIQTAATSLAQGAGGKVPLANVIATTSQGQKVIITRPASGQQVIGQQLKNVLAQQHTKTVMLQHGGTTPSRIIMKPSPAVTPVRTVSSPLLSSATPGSSVLSPSLPTVIQQKADNGVVKTQLTSKDVSRLWVNEDIKLRNLPSFKQSPVISEGSGIDVTQEVELAEETEELGHAETYADYVPSKLRIGERHPDSVVETSSLSSVEPVDVWYKLAIPETVIDYGHLSALQLEAITYACQKHEIILPSGERAGFLIGDGAGVGKGRTVAGVIFENYLLGRKRALWLSVSNDLRVDAERDLRDIGAGKIEVYPLNKFKYAKISSKINGKVKKGVIFATYSSLIGESQSGGKYRTRLKQLLHWLSKEFDGVIIFDECHKAKNLCPVGSSKPTKTGMTVLELQRRLPNARIIYASATGASEPKNMAYMTRLGMWGKGTPFKEFTDFIQAVEKRGVGAMELVAMDMKLRGMYIARQLSFHGVTFRVEEVPIPKDYYQLYNDAVRLWATAREKFQIAAEMMDAEHKMKKSMWGQFWSAHQRFFKYLCISAKTRHCIKLAREATRSGKCVVIGLQSTGEARTLEQLEESGGELNDFVSTAKGVFQTLVEKHFPAPDRKKTFDIFGIGSSLFSDSPRSSPTPASSKKRKKDLSWLDGGSSKKSKTDSSDDSDSDSSKDSGSSSSDSNLSLSESEQEPSDSDNDDFNPFGNGSDSDDDPWLKKVKKPKVEKKKKPKKEKKKKKKKKKEEKKKKKEKKPRPKKANMSDSDDDSSDDFADIEEQMDKALEAAGLRGNKETSNSSWSSSKSFGQSGFPGMDAVDKVIAMKRELLDTLEQIGDKLPPNTLDELIDQLGGPDNVAEMTGRKGRVVTNEDGSIQYESRSEYDTPLEYLNLAEKQRFMDGEKTIAIISEAASSGISLQADRRAANQRRRVHITLELPWSADRAIQQFGRTHRSNQVSAPEYIFLISELAGERRFAATVAKRLESLGALTHGDRRATESRDLSRFNIDNKYGRAALESVMKSVLSIERPTVPLPKTYSGNFLQDVMNGLIGVGMISKDNYMSQPMLEKDYNNINKFLNRILGLEIEVQNHLFKYFTETLQAIILEAKRNGRWDMGILDLGSGEENVRQLKTETFVGNFSGSTAKAELHTVSVERGTAWTKAMTVWRDHSGSEDGFYLSSQICNNTKLAILAVATKSKRNNERLYQVYRPNTGLQIKMETIAEIKKRYKKVLPDTAQGYWQDQYRRSAIQCTHLFTKGSCRKMDLGLPCEIGLRSRTYNILGGSVLSVWNKVESVLASVPGGVQARMQIIRLRTEEGNRIVGTLIPSNAVAALTNVLKQEATRTYSKHHANYLPDLSLPL